MGAEKLEPQIFSRISARAAKGAIKIDKRKRRVFIFTVSLYILRTRGNNFLPSIEGPIHEDTPFSAPPPFRRIGFFKPPSRPGPQDSSAASLRDLAHRLVHDSLEGSLRPAPERARVPVGSGMCRHALPGGISRGLPGGWGGVWEN